VASMLEQLASRGLLDTTSVMVTGEFGRTPKVNQRSGRDHYPRAWTTVLAGGGIKGGQAFGKTSADGTTVEDGQVDVPDLLATLCRGVGVDPREQNISELGRPIRLAEGKPIEEVLA